MVDMNGFMQGATYGLVTGLVAFFGGYGLSHINLLLKIMGK